METWAFNIRAGKRMLGWQLFWGGLRTDAVGLEVIYRAKMTYKGH